MMPPLLFSTPTPADAFLPALLDLSLAGAVCYAPVLDPTGQVVDFTFVYLNPAAQRLLALPARPDVSYAQHFAGTLTTGEFAFHRAAFQGTERREQVSRYRLRDQETLLHVAAQRLNDYLLVSLEPVAADAAQATAEKQAQLDQLFMQAPAAICVLDGPDWVYRLVNPSYQQAFPGRPLLGRPLLEALPELHDSPIPGILTQVYTTGQPFQAQELPLRLARAADGPPEDMYWTFTYQARRTAQQIDGILVFAYDVTEQVRARQEIEASQRQTQALADELRLANEQLTRANEDLDNFIYTASHDLKAPITNIEGLLQALRQELTRPASEANVEQVLMLMQDSIRRFQRTIKYLTDVSRLHPSHQQPVTPVSLPELVDGVRLDLAPLLAVSGGAVELAAGSCPTVAFAEKDLRSIVYNLISNALKYRAPDRVPRVQVRCHSVAPDAVELEVQDNGLGLSREQQQKIFGMFQRLHDHVDGAGIGLYLVKKVVDNAGGHIAVESRPGAGSTFRVRLPQPAPATGRP